MVDLRKLAEPFEPREVHWRAQTLTQDGTKALAVAYIDARNVMDRLDDVCGPAGWQSRYTETPRGRVLCELGIFINGEWVWKSDGAGDTDVEGEKGGISDALKRAAVHWGIGRYLYRLGSVWVPCQSREYKGKMQWQRWTADPWQFVRQQPPRNAAAQAAPKGNQTAQRPQPDNTQAIAYLKGAETLEELAQRWGNLPKETQRISAVIQAKDARKAELQPAPAPDAGDVLQDEVPY